MKSWSVIRVATDEDKKNLESRAQTFCKRHKIKIESGASAQFSAGMEISYRIYDLGDHRLEVLWNRMVRRLFNSRRAEGIVNDCIGYTVKS